MEPETERRLTSCRQFQSILVGQDGERAVGVKDGHLRLGIDLGGTEIKAAVLSDDTTVRWSARIETLAQEGRDAVLDRMVQLVATASSAVAPGMIETFGVAIPGVIDQEAGRI